MNRYDTFDSAFDCTPRQYHARVDKLWEALGLTEVQDEDVFTLAARALHDRASDAGALEVLRELFAIHPLVDMIYDVRDREGKGWDGPLVTRWAAATAWAEALIEGKP